MESIKNRTSIRKYAEKEVSEELLNRLLSFFTSCYHNAVKLQVSHCRGGNKK